MRRMIASCALALLSAGIVAAPKAAPSVYAPVIPGRELSFPADFGSHPSFRTEWWYITGWLTTEEGESLGFQITFFRTKPDVDQANPSAFSPRQLLIAHCAISDPKHGGLWQDQRIRRAGMGIVDALEGDTDVKIERWTLKREGDGYAAVIDADDFAVSLRFNETQPILINGNGGVSQKGPEPNAASFYYSLPHLRVGGDIVRQKLKSHVAGEAWLDHEWSSEYLDANAVGWDWIGINLTDGGALMAFNIRGADGRSRWSGGTYRNGAGETQVLQPRDVAFSPSRNWRSPETGIIYPVQWIVRAGPRELELRPLLDNQENDTRLSTGAIYWEGAVSAFEHGQPAGRGYLELTGYGERLKLR